MSEDPFDRCLDPDDCPLITYAQVIESVKDWPYPDLELPVFFNWDFQRMNDFLKHHDLTWTDYTEEKDSVYVLPVDIPISKLSIFSSLDESIVRFQEPNCLEPA